MNEIEKNVGWTPEHPKVKKYVKDILSPWKQFLFMLTNLPGAMFFGVKLVKLNEERAEVQLPYSWRSKNPFRSIYFAAQCAAGEFATGVLAMLALQGHPSTSILVSNARAQFSKKADTLTTFTCEQGQEVIDAVQKAMATNTPQTIEMMAVGRNKNGEEVSRIYITWTFKRR